MTLFASEFQLPFRWRVNWVIRLTLWVCGLTLGDIAYISKKVRQQLDEAGFTEAKIYASNDLDENTILNLKMQKAKIDVWGVGTKLITAYDQQLLGAVYKIVCNRR